MFLTDVMTYLMKGTLTNISGVLKGDGKTLDSVGVDATPTSNSENLITSGGVYAVTAPIDVSASITAHNNRISFTNKKAFRYGNRVDLWVEGTFVSDLTENQQTLLTTTAGIAPSYQYLGVALVKGTTSVRSETTSTNAHINVPHGGVSAGDAIIIQISWFIGT